MYFKDVLNTKKYYNSFEEILKDDFRKKILDINKDYLTEFFDTINFRYDIDKFYFTNLFLEENTFNPKKIDIFFEILDKSDFEDFIDSCLIEKYDFINLYVQHADKLYNFRDNFWHLENEHLNKVEIKNIFD